MSAKQDRQGARTASDIERKYNFGKTFAELLGLINDARDHVDSVESSVYDEIKQMATSLTRDAEQIVLAALASYSMKSELEEFDRTVTAELAIMAEKISMSFESLTETITSVDGNLQTVIEELEKHFEFTIDGLTIKAGANSMQLVLDNDLIQFVKNGQQFGWWDGVNFHTGNIYVAVDELAQFGNYGFVPFEDADTDGLDLVRVGG